MGEGRKQNQTDQCQKLFQDAIVFGSYTGKLTPRSETWHFPLLPCPGDVLGMLKCITVIFVL